MSNPDTQVLNASLGLDIVLILDNYLGLLTPARQYDVAKTTGNSLFDKVNSE